MFLRNFLINLVNSFPRGTSFGLVNYFLNKLEKVTVGAGSQIERPINSDFIHTVNIGRNVTIGQNMTILGRVEIQDNCVLSANVTFGTINHKNIINGQRDFEIKKVTLKENCWVGANVCFGPGVTVGEYSIIGIGSVVVKDVPPYSVVVGNPGRVIRANTHPIGA